MALVGARRRVRRSVLLGAAWLAAALVCASYWLPWVRVEATAATAVRRWLGGSGQGDLLVLRGRDLPRVASGRASGALLDASGVPRARAQARLAWTIPALALALAGGVVVSSRRRRAGSAVAVVGAAASLALLLRIATVPGGGVATRVHVEPALWLTLGCFVALAATGAALSRSPRR